VKSQLKLKYIIENIVMGQTIIKEDTLVYIIVKLNLNINVKIKYKTRVIQNMCRGAFVNVWVILQIVQKLELCVNFFSTDPMFSMFYFW